MKTIMITLLAASTTLFAVPKAIVFDFGGVLTNEPNREVIVDFLQNTFQLSKEEFEEVNREKRKAVQSGKTDEEFWIDYGAKIGFSLSNSWSKEFKEVLKKGVGVNEGMFYLVDELKQKGLIVAMLSNIDKRLASYIREFGFYEPFDPCLLSCDIGLEKPDFQAYEYLIHTLKLSPKEILFIDDRLENVEAARYVGLEAILFQSEEELRKELQIILK